MQGAALFFLLILKYYNFFGIHSLFTAFILFLPGKDLS